MSIFILLIHIILDLQLIIGDRYKFLDEVRVSIHFRAISDESHYKVWRNTLDNKSIELADKTIDTLNRLVIYQNAPRSTFVRTIFIETDSAKTPIFDSISVTIGNRTTTYSQATFKQQWLLSRSASGVVRQVLPTNHILPTSILPEIGDIINWKGDWLLISYLCLHNLNILVFIFLFLLLAKRPNWINYVFRSDNNAQLLVFCFFYSLLKNVFQIWDLDADLDPSFRAGLAWAQASNFRWGKDLIFTYGPYFWIMFASIITPANQLYKSLGINLLLTCISFFIFFSYTKSLYQKSLISYQALLVILLLFAVFHYDFLDYVIISVILLFFESVTKSQTTLEQRKGGVLLFVAIGLLAILSLMKFSYVAFAFSQLLILSFIFISKKRWTSVLLIWLAYPLYFVALWALANQSIIDIPNYLINGYEIASGYSEAMSSPLWDDTSILLINGTSVLFLLVVLFVLSVLLLFIVLTRRKQAVQLVGLLSAPMIFLAFKEGFVRFDPPHMALFYSQILLLTIIFFLVASESGIPFVSVKIRPLFVITVVACCVAPAAQFDIIKSIPILLDRQALQQTVMAQRHRLIDSYKIEPAHTALLTGAAGTDIIPTNISLLYALGTTWKPRPVIQSYSAYTTKLSIANGNHYTGKQAPDYVIYNYQSIDNRYPIFDEPGLVRALLTNYEVYSNQGNSYLILQHRPKPASKNILATRVLNGQLGQLISVPTMAGAQTFMSADVSLTWLGKLMNIFYKIPPLRLKIIAGQKTYTHRVIRRTLKDSVLISTYIKDADDFTVFLNHKNTPNISSLEIIGNSLFYEHLIPIETYFQQIATQPEY